MSHLQQLRKGSTPLLILSLLTSERMYGYQIMNELEERSDGYFTMTAALLYPTMQKLEDEGLVVSEWGEGKRRRKYYTITQAGQQALADYRAEWVDFVAQLFKTLQASQKEA